MTDPAFLFYAKDWLEGTAEMSAAEKGIYIDLLCFQHQRGFIPEDTKRIASMVGMKEDDFLNYWEYIKGKFKVLSPGKLINEKLLRVAGERSEHSKMRTILGTFGGQLRALKTAEKNKEKIRKAFNYKEFLDVEDSLLASCLAIWLAKSQANTKQIIEDGDAIEDEINNIIRYPFNSEIFKKSWELWLSYKKQQFGFTYQPIGMQAALDDLEKLAGAGNEQKASELILYAMGKNWQGFYPIKGTPKESPKHLPEAKAPKA